MSTNNIPEALQSFVNGLLRPSKSRYKTAGSVRLRAAKAVEAATVTDFAYNGLTASDLQYDASQYPVAGTFTGITPAWLNDLNTVPEDWQWSDLWAKNHQLRTDQIDAEMAFIKDNVPKKQTYSGTTADIIQQWYTKGMWSPSPSPNDPRKPPLPIFAPEKVSTLTENWIVDDQEFARQRLGGANPNVIKLADTGSYNIADWISKAANASSLAELQKILTAAQTAGELYVCDYTPVVGPAVTQQFVVKGRFLEAPICFFTVDTATKTLVPAAIQIKGTDPTSYIFTPGDSNDADGDAWLLAKLWAASADQQWWFSGSHLMNCHSVVMIFGIAALNQIMTGTLPADHSMVILAKPFLTQVFNINNLVVSAPGSAEGGIYQKGSFCDQVLPTGRIGLYQIINDLYQNYNFDDNAFPTEMENRGIKDGALVFPYYDDGKVWWTAINKFVSDIVEATYPDDAKVASDAALKGWMDAAKDAFNHDGTTRFTPPATKDSLTAVFTNLLFTCSAKHTSVNDTMLPGWAFTPNGPFAMMAAAPTDAASVTRATVLGSLPNPQTDDLVNVIQNQITFVMAGTAVVDEAETAGMSQTDDSVMLKYHPYPADSTQEAAVKAFWNAIWIGSDSVKAQIANNQNARIATWKGSTPVPNSLSYYYLSAFLSPCVGPEYLNAPTMNSIQI